MEALLRYPPRQRRARAQEWARRSHAIRKPGEVPLEDQIARAKWDRKGAVIREGRIYRGDGAVFCWAVRWSVAGRSNQMDVVVDGRVWRTGGRRQVERFLRRGVWIS